MQAHITMPVMRFQHMPAILNLKKRLTKWKNKVITSVHDKKISITKILQAKSGAWAELPDHRKPSPNTKYALSDAVNSAMSVFFIQSQSFLTHHQTMSKKKRGKQNLQALFEVEKVPSDNQIRNLLVPLNTREFARNTSGSGNNCLAWVG